MNSYSHGVIYFILLLILIGSISAIEITTEETGKITSFYDDYYIVRLNGTLTVHNPTAYTLYHVELPLKLSTLDFRSLNSTSEFYINNEKIFIQSLPANSTQALNYKVAGISPSFIKDPEKGLLKQALYYYGDPKIYANIMGSLRKAPMEKEEITGRDARVISVELRNPSAFKYFINFIKVIKTDSIRPDLELDSWDFSDEKKHLDAYENYNFDFLDVNAVEGQVYWLQTDIYFDDVRVFGKANLTIYDQDDLFIPIINDTYEDNFTEEELSLLDKRIFVRKMIPQRLFNPGDRTNITLIVNNLANTPLKGNLLDVIPDGFKLIDISDNGIVNDSALNWKVDIGTQNAMRYRYEVEYIDVEGLGVDYFPAAKLDYDINTIYSSVVPFVRKYVPEKKLFIQKTLEFLDNDEVGVTLSVHNLGDGPVENLVIKDFLDDDVEFKEVSQSFYEKGVWAVPIIEAGDIWETRYVSEKTALLNTFPEVFGAAKASVMKTIILSNIVESNLIMKGISNFEIIGILSLALLLMTYVLPQSLFARKHRNELKKVALTQRELANLRSSSEKKINSSLDGSDAGNNHHNISKEKPHIPKPQRHGEYHSILERRDKKIQETYSMLSKLRKERKKE